MKSIVNRILVFFVIGALTGVLAFGKTTEKKVTFRESLTVNGTLVKKGTYKVILNEETGELTIKKGGEVIATAYVRLEKTGEPYSFYISSAADPTKAPDLVSISWKDGNLARLVNKDDAAAASSKP